MQCALYLDPRYRTEILRKREMVERAEEIIVNLANRTENIEGQARQAVATPNDKEPENELHLIDFDDTTMLDEYLARGSALTSPSQTATHHTIEQELELFNPQKLSTNQSIIEFWERTKDEYPIMYKVALILYAIPPTKVQIERDFSALDFIFTARRYNLSPDLLEAILTIHLNIDLFREIRDEELANVLKSPIIDLELE